MTTYTITTKVLNKEELKAIEHFLSADGCGYEVIGDNQVFIEDLTHKQLTGLNTHLQTICSIVEQEKLKYSITIERDGQGFINFKLEDVNDESISTTYNGFIEEFESKELGGYVRNLIYKEDGDRAWTSFISFNDDLSKLTLKAPTFEMSFKIDNSLFNSGSHLDEAVNFVNSIKSAVKKFTKEFDTQEFCITL